MHFSLKLGLILLIIQATLSSPVEKKDNNNAVSESPGSTFAKVNEQLLLHINNDLDLLQKNLNNIQQKIESVNKTERANYGDKPGSQEFYERSKSLLQKFNRYIKVTLNYTNTIKRNINHDSDVWYNYIFAIKILNFKAFDTLIDTASEYSYIKSITSSNLMSKTLYNLISEMKIIYNEILDTYEWTTYKFFHKDDVLKIKCSLSNDTVLKEIYDDYSLVVTYMIEKLSNLEQKLQSELAAKGVKRDPQGYSDYNIFLNHMTKMIKIKQNMIESEIQVKGVIPDLNYYIYNTLNAVKQIQANMNHTTLRGTALYNYLLYRINVLNKIIQFMQSSLSHEDNTGYWTSNLVDDVKGDIELIHKKLKDTTDSVNLLAAEIYYSTSDTITSQNVDAWITKYFSQLRYHITNDVFSPESATNGEILKHNQENNSHLSWFDFFQFYPQ